MTSWPAFQSADLAELEEPEQRRNRRSPVSMAKRAAWRAEHPTEADMVRSQRATAPEPWPPDDPAAAAAWQAYLNARQRAGQDHAAVVRLDIEWGSRSQAIGGARAAEGWGELADWFSVRS